MEFLDKLFVVSTNSRLVIELVAVTIAMEGTALTELRITGVGADCNFPDTVLVG